MIVAFLNQKGGVGKTTLSLHVAGAWAARGRPVVVIDADPQGWALDWSEQRTQEGLPRLFGVLGLARDTPHVEAPAIARGVHHVLIDGSPRIAPLMRSAMLAAESTVPERWGHDHVGITDRVPQISCRPAAAPKVGSPGPTSD